VTGVSKIHILPDGEAGDFVAKKYSLEHGGPGWRLTGGDTPTCKPVQLASSLIIFFAISPIANDFTEKTR
jgi:hypothetical protein